MRIGRLTGDRRGSTAVEFALVAPTFLMFVFLMLDGGRMMFSKQALNQLAATTARCAAVNSTTCPLPGATGSSATYDVTYWAVTQTSLKLTHDKVTVTKITSSSASVCGGQTGVMQAVVTMTNPKSAFALLPQAVVPSQLQATACFPIPT